MNHDRRNANRNPEWWGDLTQLVKIEKLKFLGISRYKFKLRFDWIWIPRASISRYKFKLRVWFCSWLKSPNHSGFRFAFRWPFDSVGPTLRSYPRTTYFLLTTCEQAHYISPHELVASFMAGKSARKSQKRHGPSSDINPAQATHLWDSDAEVCELGGDASLPSSACIAFPRLASFHKTGTEFGGGN